MGRRAGRFHGPGSESSPMFTDLSARSCIERRRRWKSSLAVYADDRHGPTHRGAQARGSNSARQLKRMVCRLARGRSGKAKPPRTYGQIRGYTRQQPRTIPEFQYSSRSETALFSAGSCLRSAVQGRNPKATNSRKGKTLKSPPIGGFSNSRAEPESLTERLMLLSGVLSK